MATRLNTLYVAVARITVMISGLVVAFISSHMLTPEEQGYLFTFMSLIATLGLFELGITNIILHNISHFKTEIDHAKIKSIAEQAVVDLNSIINYSTNYFKRASFLFILVVGVGGIIFFYTSRDFGPYIEWHIPWLLMILGASLSLFNVSLYTELEGFNRIDLSYRVRIESSCLIIIIFTFLALLSLGLIAYPISLLISNLYAKYRLENFINEITEHYKYTNRTPQRNLSIKGEQNRFALSAIAGYITTSAITPYAFYYYGPEEAGKIGLTFSIFVAIGALAMARSIAEAPTYSGLIAVGRLDELKISLYRTLSYCLMLSICACLCAIVFRVYIDTIYEQFSERILDLTGFLIFSFLIVVNTVLSAISTVLRAFKKEKLMWPSIIAAMLMLVSQFVLRFEPVFCILILALYNAFVFIPISVILLNKKLRSC